MFGEWIQYLQIATAIYCWLIAGVFFAFSDFIMRSLAAAPAPSGITAMQSINRVIYRSVFVTGLFIVSAMSILLTGMVYLGDHPVPVATVISCLVFLLGVMGVTISRSIPLNERLDGIQPDAAQAEMVWSHYLRVWGRWNHVRTIASAVAASLMTLSALGISEYGW